MNVKVHEIMTTPVVTTEPHRSIARIKRIIQRNHIGVIPVIDKHNIPVGIISTVDLLNESNDQTNARAIMTEDVYTIPQYDDISIAARIMRSHHVHHLVVTHEQKIVGLLSAFDLIKLVENHRFIDKNAPVTNKRKLTKLYKNE